MTAATAEAASAHRGRNVALVAIEISKGHTEADASPLSSSHRAPAGKQGTPALEEASALQREAVCQPGLIFPAVSGVLNVGFELLPRKSLPLLFS